MVEEGGCGAENRGKDGGGGGGGGGRFDRRLRRGGGAGVEGEPIFKDGVVSFFSSFN